MKAVRTKQIDVDNVGVKVFNDNNKLIADGHYNVRTNWAHITTLNNDQELEDDIVEKIESRELKLS